MQEMRATLIVNPCSHRVTEERLRAVERELARFAKLAVVLTQRRGHATELARDAAGDAILHRHEPDLEIAGFGRAAMAFVSNDAVFSCVGRLPLRLSSAARFELALDFLESPREDRMGAGSTRYVAAG